MTQALQTLPGAGITKFEQTKRRGVTTWVVGEREGKEVLVELYTGVTNGYGRPTGKAFYAKISNKLAVPGEGYTVFEWLPFEDKTVLTGDAPKRYSQKALEEFHAKALTKLQALITAGNEEVLPFLAGAHIY
jgi:hypothetical protein